MKRNTLMRVVAVTFATLAWLGSSATANAQTLQVQVQAGAASLTVQDNGAGDADATIGKILFSAPVGSYDVFVTVAQSKPIIGDPLLAHVDMFLSALQGGSDPLTVKLTDIDFPGPINDSATMIANVGGNTSRPKKTSFQAYVDPTNQPFGTSGANICTPGPQGINSSASKTCSLNGPFSMTTVATTQLQSGDSIGFDYDVHMALPRCGFVGDFVWHDQNRDGLQDSGEPGIDGVKLTLKDMADNVLATTFTGINPINPALHGYYQFEDVCAGSYKVELDDTTVPAGFFPTLVEVGADRTIDSNANPTFTTLLVDGDSDVTLDFGFQSPCDGSIGDFVWHDLNENGIQDLGEPGIPGVVVTLNGGAQTSITDINGNYLFTGLCPGSYTVQVTPPAGYIASPTLQGGNTALDSNPNPETVSLANNEHNLTIDFGFYVQRPPELHLEKSPKGGTFTTGSQVSFTIVVSNTALAGAQSATNVHLTDALPGNGGLVWQSATTSQGSCVNPIAGNLLDCSLGDIAPGQSVTVVVTSTATTPFSACQSQPNPVALATADGGLSAQDSGSLTCTPPPPQLRVEKSPKNGTFTIGSPVSFTIVVSNPAPPGSSDAQNVQLTDALPGNGGLVWQSAIASQGSCTIVANNLSCSLGNIPAGGSVTVTVNSTPTTPLDACQLQPNPAAIATADGGLQAQDSGSLSCTPPPPQLRVVKTPDGGVFTTGSQVSFTIVVSNPAAPGSSPAKNVQLTDTLPGNGGLVWQSASASQGSCAIVSNNLSCSLGDIPAGGSVTVTVTSTATTPFDACQLQPNPAAIATADGGLQAQDSGSLTCTPPPPQLRVVKTPKNGTFTAGAQASFTIVVSNPAPPGSSPATNVQLTDVLPGNGGLVWQTATTTQGSCVNPIVNNTLNCSLGTIAAGASVTVVVKTTATTTIAACQYQPNPAAIATATGGLKAQDSGSLTCNPGYETYTIGGWGAPPSGNNIASKLAANFAIVYPNGVIVGGNKTMKFTKASAIQAYAPDGGTPGVLKSNLTNPLTTPAGIFGTQVLALRLNVDFSNLGILKPGLANLKITPGHPLAGYTVLQVLNIANQVLGGDLTKLPAGMSVSDLNKVVDALNNNFHDGVDNNGWLQ